MKLKTYFNAALLCLAAGLLAACADDIMGDGNKDKQAQEEVKGVKFTTNEPKMRAMSRALVDDDGNIVEQTATRTLIKHTPGLGADAYWDANDYIFVKNKYNQWKKSIAISLFDDGRSAEFTLPGAPDDYAEGCEVRYTITPSLLVDEADAAIIPFNQTQSAPNDFSHAGRVGDSGIGTAHDKGNGMFNFELQHLPHYLCFLPRCENASLANNIRLTKIRLDNDNSDGTTEVVGATYLLDQDPFNSVGIDTRYNAIELQSTDGNGFPIAATTADAAADACYMAILPGEHDLILTYTIKDPTTNVETKITKKVSGTFKSGEITDITSNLSLRNQPMYYTWDSENNVGDIQYDSSSPTTLSATTATVYAFGFGDANVPGTTAHVDNTVSPTNPKRIDATHTYMNGVPNVNEMMWYAYKGDARWVNQGPPIAVFGNLVRTAGVWLKKKAKILADEHITEAYMRDGFALGGGAYTDYRINPINGTAPKVSVGTSLPANLADYFFVPALGYYVHYGNNWYDFYNPEGYYWTSSATPTSPSVAYGLYFSQTGISIKENYVYNPYCVLPFE
ncbi:hypothetical protein [Segatella oulorum]|uniref:hypothetical protein n=1 Tax=Segatella oulorum TaxID=28136 RepID=UPI0028E1B994|nr:hypothetical protein [Segatella oulorum]